jgi:hypothetical protein
LNVSSDNAIDLDDGHPVTPADVAALRLARVTAPAWLSLSWRELSQLLPPAARHPRPAGTDAWQPFSLA